MALLGLFFSAPAHAAVFNVNNTTDVSDSAPGDGVCITSNGWCTLRAAIEEANALAGADTINLPAGTYTLTILSELVITSDITITGAGAATTIIHGNKAFRNGMGVLEANSGIVNISGVTIRNGGRTTGGGILLDQTTLTLTNSTVSGNNADFGAGIFSFGNLTNLTLINSTVSGGNFANSSGGGIAISANSNVTLINSTVSGNFAILNGGGIWNQAGVLTAYSSTITTNVADAGSGDAGTGGGVSLVFGSTFTFQNTIIANNFGIQFNNDDCGGTVTSNGNNLMSTLSGCAVNGGGVTVAPPMLGPLADNGGPTRTHAPLAGSPAIDAGDPTGCLDHLGVLLLEDQRGATRHFDGDGIGGAICDIGAVEFGAGIGAPVDFDGNGTSDVVAFRGGAWLFYNFTTGMQTGGTWTGTSPGCIPVAMDYDGDGKTDFTQRCGGAWHFYNANGSYNKGIWVGSVAGDRPVPADYDGDGKDDVVIYRGGAWLFYDFATGLLNAAKSKWTGGGGGCIPAPMDYDGDGTANFTQLCGGSWNFYNSNSSYNKGIWTGGVAGDKPVPADYDGDGTEDVVVFRGGAWLFYDFATGLPDAAKNEWTGTPLHWLGGTSLPAPIDYDGDGTVDFTVYSGGPWHFYNANGSYNKGIWTGGVVNDRAISRRLLP